MRKVNPFLIYISSFTLVFILYSLNLSYLYPKISLGTKFFFLCTFLISIIYLFVIKKREIIQFRNIAANKKDMLVTLFVYICFITECIYNKGMPLIMIYSGQDYDYKSFGIPTFHIFFITFLNFYTVYLFHKYISEKKTVTLLLFISCLLIPLLMYYRSILVFSLSACLFIYIMGRKIKFKTIINVSVILVIFLYLFGVAGNLRVNTSNVSDNPFMDSRIILEVGKAKDIMYNNEILGPFYWTYLYASSPLANLELNIDRFNHNHYDISNFSEFFKRSILFDSISNRLWGDANIPRVLITPDLTVATMFTDAYSLLGWLGPYLMFIHICILYLIFIITVPKDSKYFVSGNAILCSLTLLGTFDNLFPYTAFGFTILYPIALQFYEKKLRRLRW